MQDPYLYLTLAASGLAGIAILATAALRGWNGWLDLKRAELGRRGEEADLKERIRKLEAIAAGVDL